MEYWHIGIVIFIVVKILLITSCCTIRANRRRNASKVVRIVQPVTINGVPVLVNRQCTDNDRMSIVKNEEVPEHHVTVPASVYEAPPPAYGADFYSSPNYSRPI